METKELINFLHFLYNNYHQGSFFCVVVKKESIRHFFFQNTEKERKKAVELIDLFKKGNNIYISLNTFTANKRSKEYCIDYIHNIFLDFDDENSFKSFYRKHDCSTIIQSSSNKYQCILKLKEPIAKSQAETISKFLAQKYHADHAHDCSRIIRCPYTLNHKYTPPAKTSVIQYATSYFIPPVVSDESPLSCDLPEPEMPLTHVNLSENDIKHAREVYAKCLQSAPMKHGNMERDYSVADMKFSIYMLSQKKTEQEVYTMLAIVSPKLSQRKQNSIEKYLQRTILKAIQYIKNIT